MKIFSKKNKQEFINTSNFIIKNNECMCLMTVKSRKKKVEQKKLRKKK